MTLSLDTAYRSFGGEVEASSTPTICRLPDSRRHQLPAIAPVISLGFSVAAAFNTANEVRNTALYTCARSVALVIVSAVPFRTGSTPWLLAIACSMIIVQVCDAGIGVVIKDRMKTVGPAGTALVNLAAVILLLS